MNVDSIDVVCEDNDLDLKTGGRVRLLIGVCSWASGFKSPVVFTSLTSIASTRRAKFSTYASMTSFARVGWSAP